MAFRSLASNIEIKSFYETHRTPPLNGLVSILVYIKYVGRYQFWIICIQVVEKDSAILEFSTEQCIPVSANHREIVHFTGIKSQKFDLVKTALQELKNGKVMDIHELGIGISRWAIYMKNHTDITVP